MIAPAIVPGRQVHKGVAVARQRRGSVASSERFTQRSFAEIIKLPARGAGVRWTPLPQAEAPTEPAGETGLMNNIRSRAEEVIMREYIYEED